MNESKQYYHYDCPAFMMRNLLLCQKSTNNQSIWEFDIKAEFEGQIIIKKITFEHVYIQGFIDQKPCDNVMIIRDSSGKVKLSNCVSALAKESDPLLKGSYCAVDGTLDSANGLPIISAHKIKKIDNLELSGDYLYESWPLEVKDFKLFVLGVIKAKLEY